MFRLQYQLLEPTAASEENLRQRKLHDLPSKESLNVSCEFFDAPIAAGSRAREASPNPCLQSGRRKEDFADLSSPRSLHPHDGEVSKA